MKTKKHTSVLALGIALLTALAAGAADQQKSAKQPEWAGLFSGASLPVVWQSVAAASDKITAALAAGTFAGIPDWAETIHLGAHALEDQVKLPDPERKKRLDGALEQAAKIADEVLAGANHQEREKTVAAHQRLKAALALAKTRLPREIVEAPPQAVRFAKAASHSHHDKDAKKQ